jgi:hypothetical protein
MNPTFFSRINDEAAIAVVEGLMAEASTCLQMEMCYVTEYGVRLLNRQKHHLLREGSFLIASNEPINDLEGLNNLAEIRPDSIMFHCGVDGSGEGPASGIMHAKLIYSENLEQAALWVGSHNLTMRGLYGINIEAAMLYRGHRDEQIFKDAREHLGTTAKASRPGPIALKEKVFKTAKSLIIECEADENILTTLRKQPTDFCLSLSHELFDQDCIPPGKTIRDVRLIVYPASSLTEDGPQQAPLFIRSGQVTGVTFTEYNTKAGSGASWNDKPGYVRMSMCQMDRKRIASPLKAEPGDSRIEKAVTICAFFVNTHPEQVELHLDGPFQPSLEYDVTEHSVEVPDLSEETEADLDLTSDSIREPLVIKVYTRSNAASVQIVPYHGSLKNWHIRQLEAYARKHQITLRFEKLGPFYKYIRRGNLLSTGEKYFVKG